MYSWLTNNRWMGKYIRDYSEHRGISRGSRILALVLLWASIGSSIVFIIEALAIRIVLLVVASAVSVFLFSLKTVK